MLKMLAKVDLVFCRIKLHFKKINLILVAFIIT